MTTIIIIIMITTTTNLMSADNNERLICIHAAPPSYIKPLPSNTIYLYIVWIYSLLCWSLFNFIQPLSISSVLNSFYWQHQKIQGNWQLRKTVQHGYARSSHESLGTGESTFWSVSICVRVSLGWFVLIFLWRAGMGKGMSNNDNIGRKTIWLCKHNNYIENIYM